MSRFVEKKSPERVLTWLSGIKSSPDDRVELMSVAGVSGMAGECLGIWDYEALTDGAFTGESLSDFICTMAQDSADHHRQNSMFLIRHMRGDKVRSAFTLKMKPQEASSAGIQDDEDASPVGQIRALMAHNRAMAQISGRAPLAAMEAIGRLLDQSNENLRRAHDRIATLEKQREKAIDREAELLKQLRDIVSPTPTEQALEFAQALPELAKALPLLTAGIKTLVKM